MTMGLSAADPFNAVGPASGSGEDAGERHGKAEHPETSAEAAPSSTHESGDGEVQVIDLSDTSQGNERATTVPDDGAHDDLPSHSKLGRMREADLQALADERGVDYDVDGTKAELIEALEKDAGRQ